MRSGLQPLRISIIIPAEGGVFESIEMGQIRFDLA